jgi:hypothetical protein
MDVRDQRDRTARLPGLFCGLSLLLAPAAVHAAEAEAEVSLGGEASASAAEPAADTGAPEAPEDEDTRPKNPANYEFGFVTVSAYQNWSLAGRWLYFGAGGGLGPPLYRYSKLGNNEAGWDPSLEIAHANAYLRISPARFVDIDVGPQIALGSALFNVKDPPMSAFAVGGYVDLRVGSEKIKVGPRFEYDDLAYATYHEHGWRITPLMVRVMH